MKWEPIEEDKIWDLINKSFKKMSLPQRNLWESIRIDPEKWEQHPYGDEGNGFWVVAIYGKNIICKMTLKMVFIVHVTINTEKL